MKKRNRHQVIYSSARKVSEQQDQGQGPSSFKVPKGYELFKFKKGLNTFDILPFVVSKNNFRVRTGKIKAGQGHFECTFWIHKDIGPEGKWVVCPRETFGKRCGVCDYMRRKMKANTLSEEDRKALSPKERQLFIVRDHADGKKKKILENSHYRGFGALLKDKLLAVPESHYYQNFFHLTDGCTLTVSCKEEKLPGGSFISPANIEMEKRKKAIDLDINDLPCLDKLLIEMDGDEMEELFLEGQKSDKKKDKNKKGKKDDEDEDDDTEEEEDEDGDDDEEGDDDDDSEDDDDDSESEEDDSDEDDDDSDDEDEEGEDDDEEDEEGDEESEVGVGDTVSFKYKGKKDKKPKKRTGEVVDIKEKKGLGYVQCDDRDMPYIVKLEELTVVEPDDDEEEDDDEDDDRPRKKKRNRDED